MVRPGRQILPALIAAALLISAPGLAIEPVIVSYDNPDDRALNGSFPRLEIRTVDDTVLVVWEESSAIWGRRVSSSGTPLAPRFQISPEGGPFRRSGRPSLAYAEGHDLFFVVWSADDDNQPLAENEFEIFGQLIDGSNDALVGDCLRISEMGPDGDPDYDAEKPDVVFNPTEDEFYVVWQGDDDIFPLVDDEFEIWGLRLDAGTGILITPALRVSNMGPIDRDEYDAIEPQVAYNPTDNEYLVVWSGDHDVGGLIDGEFEIFAQRVAANGLQTGDDDVRISDLGGTGHASFDAHRPAVHYHPGEHRYLVVWDGDDSTGPLVESEEEIFGQFIEATSLVGQGINDFRISFAGPDGDLRFSARSAQLAYDTVEDEFFVIWHSDDDSGMVWDEFEIWGQRIDGASSRPVGARGTRLTRFGPPMNRQYWANLPDVIYVPSKAMYLSVLTAESDQPPLQEGEFEVYSLEIESRSIFSDGFESGDTGPWSMSSGSGRRPPRPEATSLRID